MLSGGVSKVVEARLATRLAFPLDMGESRAGKDRLWYSDLLGVYFRVADEKMTVRIMAVGPARRR